MAPQRRPLPRITGSLFAPLDPTEYWWIIHHQMVIHMYPRYLQKRLEAALADTPVVLLTGARQTGKSTLAQAYAAAKGAVYVTFDDPNVLAAAKDTVGFIKSLGERAVIDEVQRAPWLFTAVKLTVDPNRRPGRFLFTGSANVLLVPQVSDSLAGRMEILQLWPLSQGEIYGRKERFIDVLFGNHDWSLRPQEPQDDDIPELLVRGGYPEMIGRVESTRREAWLVAYLRTLIERDVRDLANIEGLVEMPRLLALLAARTGASPPILRYSPSRGRRAQSASGGRPRARPRGGSTPRARSFPGNRHGRAVPECRHPEAPGAVTTNHGFQKARQ